MTNKKESKPEIVDDLFENIGKPIAVDDDNKLEKKEKYDLWKTLAALRKRDLDYVNRVSEDERKDILRSVYVLMKWYSNPMGLTRSDYFDHLTFLNELVNVGFWELTGTDANDHSELIWKLMCIISDGSVPRHSWISLPKRSNSKIDKFLAIHMPLTSSHERLIWVLVNGKEGLVKLYESLGNNDKKMINDLVSEYDSYVSL
jgi:hypothetical protein